VRGQWYDPHNSRTKKHQHGMGHSGTYVPRRLQILRLETAIQH
jgi:hypothetical protein